FLLPDLTFFLRVSPKICIQRIKETRFEVTLFEKEDVLKKVWQNYEELARRFENVYIIDGEKPIGRVACQIKKLVSKVL
ncbi:MAG TPA: hypothetical protein ENF68_01045, partial [bacterium]|nr:hypothetical protein [bacterium]